jgi:hypothetical protein
MKHISCKFCGTTHKYGKAHCPSKDAVCSTCKIKGHFAKMCSKKIKAITYQEDLEPETFSDGDRYNVCSISSQPIYGQWRAKVQLGRYLVNFKADSGADVTAISLDNVSKLSPPPPSKPSKARLFGMGNQLLETVSVFLAEMKYQEIKH